MQQKIRIGLLIDGYMIPAWAYEMLRILKDSNYAEITFIVSRISEEPKRPSFIRRVWNLRNHILYILVSNYDLKKNHQYSTAFGSKNLKEIIQCEELSVKPIETKFSDRLCKEDVKKIKEKNVDVFIRLGFKILRGDILNSAKYGIWSFHHGDNTVNRGGPAGVWEVLKRWDTSGVILQIINEDLDGGIKLAETFSSTDKFSFLRNKNNFYWKALSMVPRKLEELYSLGGEKFMEKYKYKNTLPVFYSNPLFKMPRNLDILKYLGWLFFTKLKERIYYRLYFEQWVIYYHLNTNQFLPTSLHRFKKITPPKDRFWADPFPIVVDGKSYVFIEELVYSENKGTICVITIDDKGNWSNPVKVLERPYHLSYPFLLEENGDLYMLPETAANKTIELYKCNQFPEKWELYQVIRKNVYAVDPTILKYNNKFWLFCNIKEHEGASAQDELFLFYADSLTQEEWTSHPMNPIVSDVRCSRPAGTMIERDGRLFRPAQNSAKRYGHNVSIQEIITLTENDYKESPYQEIQPNWVPSVLAVHTLNLSSKMVVVDALVKRNQYSR